ncbi:hypothetical protein GPECTOR_10g797 [Gonium pectorale]|uniref:Uncharacterized protein n=1 Tax=Gonium pectorale TaxID=33097 RepID=A0A150GR02_GONPE|nr:hypothetical protein GPECTOR_10g797 [Gonium pectorale]|eukprot:KXZ52168.1 hypothetical protein GPECTOR_10g797 [Gonium pectorale]
MHRVARRLLSAKTRNRLFLEINRLKELYTGDLETVRGEADQHTRQVLDALQAASDSAAAVKEAVVEAALRQQEQAMELMDALAPPVPPPPAAASSGPLPLASRT